jgi:hypothetical protein
MDPSNKGTSLPLGAQFIFPILLANLSSLSITKRFPDLTMDDDPPTRSAHKKSHHVFGGLEDILRGRKNRKRYISNPLSSITAALSYRHNDKFKLRKVAV